ncbi:unnamed protein product [Rotaria socialis]|uniref:Uncharacterized protein n=1 Tax=Rotaria socialis TaxID=392032 RepID=A0A820MSH3_9BILA|nr:unnamed protein product [Rotaria socialis]CAF4376976.1 unnamed protein product [Rotaria socialis]
MMSIPFMDQSIISTTSSLSHMNSIPCRQPYSPASTSSLPVWKSYLYNLQMQAPKPNPIICRTSQPRRPKQYGLEFYGLLSRQEADQVLSTATDGSYLVRESLNPPNSYTLVIKFNNEVKNYKLFFDGQTSTHYVGEKHFDTLNDLVHDGLISFYLESKASDYIALMACDSQCYTNESPYGQYKAQLLHRAQTQNNNLNQNENKDISTDRSKTQSQPQIDQITHDYLLPSSTHNSSSVQQRSSSVNNSTTTTTTNPNQKLPSSNPLFFDRILIMQAEKGHNFKIHSFKGPHWCDYCANFLWGLVQQGVKCADCGFEAHKRCSEKVPQDCVPQMKYLKSIFGVDLTTLIKATTPASSAVSLTPVVLEKCINEIESRPNALDTEGLYRIAGFSDIVEEIKLAFERDCEHVDLSQERYPDIHAITCVLKLYLRQLPIPLITFDIHTQLLELRPTALSIKTVRPIIRRLPPAHFHTLKYLSEHLLTVSLHSNRNQMTVENLSIVFAPTIMRSENPDPMIGLKNSKSIQRLLEIIIEQAHDIFSP